MDLNAYTTPNCVVTEVPCAVQYGFMSTSCKREVALKYANDGKGNRMLYEIQMGMVDRGADLRWLSQYEHEEEMCAGSVPQIHATA